MSREFEARIERLAMEKWFRNPPALISAMSTHPTVGVTKAFVLQWTKFSKLFPRWVGAIMSNCPEFEVLAYEVENLMSEVVRDSASDDNHYQLLIRLGEGVGLSANEIEEFPILEESRSMFKWLWAKARNDDWLIGFSAVNGLEILGDSNLVTRFQPASGTGLSPEPYARSLGLKDEELEFFRVSEQADAGHGHETVGIIAHYTSPGREDEIISVFEEAMSRLRVMLDSVWRLAQDLDAKDK